MEEKMFFEQGDVKITNARFVTSGQTYVMSNITSVKNHKQPPGRGGPILLLLFGLICIGGFPIFGVCVAVVAILILVTQKTTYHVMLTTAGGESSALKTHQPQYATQVVGALNDAIIFRG